jgi:hypothetical protein
LSAAPKSAPADDGGDKSEVTLELVLYEGELRYALSNDPRQLYYRVRERNFVLLVNPGGKGDRLLEEMVGLGSIVRGVRAELSCLGYDPLVVLYRRDGSKCLREMLTSFSATAREQAALLEGLLRLAPELTILLLGVSNGAICTSETLKLLKNDPRVYSIQFGTPFWYKSPAPSPRSLLIQGNGDKVDAIQKGDLLYIITHNLKSLPLYLREGFRLPKMFPGHFYSWDNAKFRAEIQQFLRQKFGGQPHRLSASVAKRRLCPLHSLAVSPIVRGGDVPYQA